RYTAGEKNAAYYWVDRNVAYVLSGPAQRDHLREIAQAAYDQIDTRSQPRGPSHAADRRRNRSGHRNAREPPGAGQAAGPAPNRAIMAAAVGAASTSPNAVDSHASARIVGLVVLPLLHQFFELGIAVVGQHDAHRGEQVAAAGFGWKALALEAERASA